MGPLTQRNWRFGLLIGVIGLLLVCLLPQIASGASSGVAYTGTISGPNGPIATAEITITGADGSYDQVDQVVGSGQSTSGGAYSVGVPNDTTYFEAVSAPGYETATDEDGPGTENVSLQPASFYGTVTDSVSGNPITGVGVSLLDNGSAVDGTSTDRDGYYSFPAGDFRQGGSYWLEFDAAGTTYYDEDTVYGLTSDSGPQNVALSPTQGGTAGNLSGSVTDGTVGVDGAEVGVYTNASLSDQVASAPASDSGQYIINGLPAGQYVVAAEPPPGDRDDATLYDNGGAVTIANGGQETTGIDINLGGSSTNTSSTNSNPSSSVSTASSQPSAPSTAPSSGGTTPAKATARPEVRLTGVARVGDLLRASASGWSSTTKIRYQWQADAKNIHGATHSTLPLSAADLGKVITLEVAITESGARTTRHTSYRSRRVAKGLLATTRPQILGRARIGSRLTVRATDWTTGTHLTYRWYADGKPVHGATTRVLLLRPWLSHHSISVEVVGRLDGYAPAHRFSADVKLID